jgi:hypothetical protein
MGGQFTALRVVGTILKILGWLALILGLLVAIGALVAGFTLSNELGITGLDLGGPLAGIATFVVGVVVAIINFLFFYAAGEAIYLFLSIEENTRRAAYFVQQQATPPEPAYHPAPARPGLND